ncbi:N-(5'-phosphoribosyl)anthranilate isomerase [Larkinella knui]|uniref:N-(5'-phosphoribosyl)anthranilate isomerase n=1 Tax=Larkinella knui TaxID=2025310 RepID=A0A3P1CR25_9BACT|nr:phosphoribosylanthranilate isomerase [Larkinella knui]RRB15536.1 phosphoribosylanthranilate isomerase [Larkinella knui]
MHVKICCISSVEEARMAVGAGASAVGLVGRMPSGPGIIGDELIRTIAQGVPPPVATFLLTSEPTAEAVIEHHRRVFTNTVQLVDALPPGSYRTLRAALPGIKLVQVIHVLDEVSIDEALASADEVDALLLDSGNPKLAVKELGGTGRRHDWTLSRRIVEQSRVPVFLAGGLNPENVRQAIDTVQPFGLDICSGVRTGGKLDLKKLEHFFQRIHGPASAPV